MPLTLSSLCPDITGPIILQTYRAIADYAKTSGSEMALASGDVVEVVEKNESGQPPPCLGPQPQAPYQGSAPGSLRLPPSLVRWGDLTPSGVWAVLPMPRVTLCLSVRCGAGCGYLPIFPATAVHLWGWFPGRLAHLSAVCV